MQQNFYLTSELPPYVFASIYQLKNQAKDNGLDIIDFGMGNPDSAPPMHIMEELAMLSKDPKLYGYSITGGIEILKRAIVDYYHRRFNVILNYQTQALVTIGAKEGIASLATAIGDSDNYICVPSPSYPIHTFAFTIAKAKTMPINALSANEFLQKFVHLVENYRQKPQAVIVSYPCNPTTEIVDLSFYQELVNFCKKHQIYIISDIAYCELYFKPEHKPNSILEVKGAIDIAIEFSSVSKSYSMAGTRVGFAVGNETLVSALYKIKSYLDYGSFSPLQIVAASALSSKSDSYLADLRLLYQQRGEFFINLFAKELGWHIEKPRASMFAWAKIPPKFSHLNSFEFCKEMILSYGVAMSPGSSFGLNGEGYVRFSMIRTQAEMVLATQRLKTAFL
jgi:alanine-synthesizing transaminase